MVYRIHCYCQPNGRSDVQAEYDAGSSDLKANLDVALEFLRVRNRRDWTRPKAAKLSKGGGYRDYFEIRFMANHVQQRPIGYFGPGHDVFTILLWATEKGGKLRPSDWHAIADRRRTEITNGSASSIKLEQEEDTHNA